VAATDADADTAGDGSGQAGVAALRRTRCVVQMGLVPILRWTTRPSAWTRGQRGYAMSSTSINHTAGREGVERCGADLRTADKGEPTGSARRIRCPLFGPIDAEESYRLHLLGVGAARRVPWTGSIRRSKGEGPKPPHEGSVSA
jgi:hypothetical protein